jgi:hypothetical protein
MIAHIQATKGQNIDMNMAARLSMSIHGFPLVHWVAKVPTSSCFSTLFLQYGWCTLFDI